MEHEATAQITIDELAQALRDVEPAAILTPARIMRRIIKMDCGVTNLLRNVPHRKTYVIEAKTLLSLADRDELDLPSSATLPDRVMLINRPRPEHLVSMHRQEVLRYFWRLLYHARIDLAMIERREQGTLTPAVAVERIHAIGQSAFDEARTVLRNEKFILPPTDNVRVYSEFAAVFLELKHFLPQALPRYFPAIDDLDRVEALLHGDVDGDGLLLATRLPGAPELDSTVLSVAESQAADTENNETSTRSLVKSPKVYAKWISRAEKAAALGNDARAANLFCKASTVGEAGEEERCLNRMREQIDRIATRLHDVFDLSEDQREQWRTTLIKLIDPHANSSWTAGARIIYDLQAVCIDSEQEIFKLDLVEWLLSRGKVPIKRKLPSRQEVRIHRHLNSARKRINTAAMRESTRVKLQQLLLPCYAVIERRMRDHLRPTISDAMRKAGFETKSPPEEVARIKLIEELLDRIVDRGFITLGDLRDAVSRNNLKLPDVRNPKRFLAGDELLKIDRILARSLDGVYKRGEIYRRWPQRFSSIAFGTKVGRFITKYVAVPYLGAYVALEGVVYIAHKFMGHAESSAVSPDVPVAAADAATPVAEGVQLVGPLSIFIVGTVLLWLMHGNTFRRVVFDLIRWSYRKFYGIIIELPAELLRLEVFKTLMSNRAVRLAYRFLVRPGLMALLIGLTCYAWSVPSRSCWVVVLISFAVLNLLFNTRAGRSVEEIGGDVVLRAWRQVFMRFFLNVGHWIMDISRRALDGIERGLYSIDEYLRFNSEETRVSMVGKLLVGVLWFVVSYWFVLAFTLLIEPQVNPIKHFPVVTVSHKVLLPLIPSFGSTLETVMKIPETKAMWLSGVLITVIPGAIGFLVWEFKENWRLYRANRSKKLKPVIIGSHGESMLRLLKPGFHSGTLPKLFAKLRKLERRRPWKSVNRAVRKIENKLHHVEESVERFVQRDLVNLVAASKRWGDLDLQLVHVHLGGNNLRIELTCTQHSEAGLMLIVFEEQSGWLVASVEKTGWYNRLSAEQQEVFRAALVGFYKMSAVDLVREQVEPTLDIVRQPYDVEERGLVVWPDDSAEPESIFELRREPPRETFTAFLLRYTSYSPSREKREQARAELPELNTDGPPIFRHAPVSWRQWVRVWRSEASGENGVSLVHTGTVLPTQKEQEN